VLAFARPRLGDLRAAYLGSTGLAYGDERADAGTLSAVARLAVKLRDHEVADRIGPLLALHAMTLATQPHTFDLHVAAQTLLGLYTLERWQRQKPPLAGEPPAAVR
jgi:hypothetical protein